MVATYTAVSQGHTGKYTSQNGPSDVSRWRRPPAKLEISVWVVAGGLRERVLLRGGGGSMDAASSAAALDDLTRNE
jgi:hypothetical protein